MDDYRNEKAPKKWTTVVKELFILLCAIAISGFLGWFIGRGDMGELRVMTSQLSEERRTLLCKKR